MANQSPHLAGPDLAAGVDAKSIPDGTPLLGHADGEAVLLSRIDGKCFAIGATCTHYSGPLAEGLVTGDRVHCPWHHACFNLRTGEVVSPPALNDLPAWRVDERDGRVFVREKIVPPSPKPARRPARAPQSVVIVGAGAAGQVAAETLRREGHDGRITMIDQDPAAPVDRPNLSKDYLAGNAQPEWIPLRPPEFFSEQRIDVVRGEARELDVKSRRVVMHDGASHGFDALILATGSEPIRLDLGKTGPPMLYLRTLADSDAIIAAAAKAKRVVVLGSSFIGLEVAASLRARGLEVHVVSPEARPLERVLGPQLGDAIRVLHESKGVVFHLAHAARSLASAGVVIDGGATIAADFVVAGVGVHPRTQLAERAGLRVEKGVLVDEYLETSASGVYAAGDIARWPAERFGGAIRIEHWVVAERQGQTAARNVLGAHEKFTATPFFWSAHYDVTISYVGHAQKWDKLEVDGDPAKNDCTVRYMVAGKEMARATIFRDRESLEAEVRMERESLS
jgi:NADPH-dependent 2,4-dienoyl-CoA reductase/sulfur reductase-like enzyme/nitrite reductase/ring-hydroxylating ferredoxin subunit